MGMDQIRFFPGDHCFQLPGGQILHRAVYNLLLRQHLADIFALRTAIDHIPVPTLSERMDDLADHLLRTGINAGIQNVQNLHCVCSSCLCWHSRAASPMFRLRIP